MFSIKKLALYIIFILLFLMLREWIIVSSDALRNVYASYKYNGIVTNKYIDKENHAYRIIDFKDKTRTSLPPNSYELFEHILIGDSLKKDSGSLIGYIIKKDTTIIIDYERSIPMSDE